MLFKSVMHIFKEVVNYGDIIEFLTWYYFHAFLFD